MDFVYIFLDIGQYMVMFIVVFGEVCEDIVF